MNTELDVPTSQHNKSTVKRSYSEHETVQQFLQRKDIVGEVVSKSPLHILNNPKIANVCKTLKFI